jgi:predicted dehydrogenase
LASDSVLRLGVIGCGRVFERLHLPAIRSSSDFRLVSVCEPVPARQDWLAAALPDVGRFLDLGDLFSGPALDAVLVLTPPAHHVRPVLDALRAGQAVFVEKPLATTAEDARAIAEAAREAQRPVVVGFNRRFRRTYANLQQRIAESRSGTAPPAVRYHFQADTNAWTGGAPAPGAGGPPPDTHLLQDVASHQVDLVPWLTGRAIESVRATARQAGEVREIEIEMALAGSTEGSATILAGHGPGYVERLEVRFPEKRLVAYPGALVDATNAPGWWEKALGRAGSTADLIRSKLTGRPSLTGESLAAQLAGFAACIRDGTADVSAAGVADGQRAVAAVAACEESLARDGASVKVEAHEPGQAAPPGEPHA